MKKERRYDLDWLRVIVFGLLIFYHIGMFFVPWDWHIKNDVIYDWLQIPMVFLNQWRLPVLFVISGMGTRYALSYRSWKEFLSERSNRLLIPLLFGSLVIVAPQVYIERITNGASYTSYFDFYPHFFDGIYPNGNFSWHHLWFLPYLLVYSILLTPAFIHLRNNPDGKFIQSCKALFAKPLGVLVFLLPLLIVHVILSPLFPTTHNLVSDWYNFTFSLILFFYGFLFVSMGETFWEGLKRYRRWALVLGVISFPIYLAIIANWILPDDVFFVNIFKLLNLGSWVVVVFGYGAKYLNHTGKWLAYANKAVYPFYILHQTIIIIFAYYLYNFQIHDSIRFLLLIVVTFLGCLIGFEFVKKFKITRTLFGVKG